MPYHHVTLTSYFGICMGYETGQLTVFDAFVDVAATVIIAASLKLQAALPYRHAITLQSNKDVA